MKQIFYLLFLSCSLNCYAQISIINLGTSQQINSLSKKGNTILIGGIKNFIAKSYNNCDSIILINSPVIGSGWSRLVMVDSTTYFIFYIIGSSTIIYKTNDGGISWTEKFNNPLLFAQTFDMFDDENGVLMGDLGITHRTFDGGDSWSVDTNGVYNAQNSVTFSNSIIYAEQMFSTAIHYSTNQGITWSQIGGLPYQPQFRRLFLLNDSSIYGVCNAPFSERYLTFCLNRTSSFTNKLLNMTNPHDVIFTTFSEGYIVGEKNGFGTIQKTTDTGNTWVDYQTSHTGAITNIIFLNDSIALIGGTDGYLAKWNKNSLALSIVKESNKTKSNISILPNPATTLNEININSKKDASLSIILFDIIGRKMKSMEDGKIYSGKNKFINDITTLPSGFYFYQIIIDDAVYNFKIIKN